ncbi:hypothetical protein FSP39_013467 [Pinctada imbricata]|uniref:Mab-21-like HhH/H2TH-like domain-containing protein n=1 Tax=Pinctada imbricata TaxID=66713 RepID=A0AA89C966_PINIB|nr:hypothetical protein FSP39_013467 [Pinctada imbricata]
MAESPVCNDISLISKGLYRIVNDVIGPECFVKLRRRRLQIDDVFANCDEAIEEYIITSGSRAEGFDFRSSDFDHTLVDRNVSVRTRSVPNTYKRTIVHMDTENVSPGYSFIRCFRYDNNNLNLKSALVLRGSYIYVSSKMIRESFLSTSISSVHGPCQTSTVQGYEHDFTYALKCPFWPEPAASFISRAQRQKWPSDELLTDVCQDGCLLVPINSKKQYYNDMIDLEWRISFSLAEKKLIYSVSQSQFLCYGLSKLFLNECLKKFFPFDDALCSYYIKTAVFWEISENPYSWSPYNFLFKFWNVFRRLINWVSKGYCPNFFIPENNMFYGKICGELQKTVLSKLRELYLDGYWSLLACTSMSATLSQLIVQPQIAELLSCDEAEYVPISEIELDKLKACFVFDRSCHIMDKDAVIRILRNTLNFHPESEEEIVVQRLRINHILQYYAERLFLSSKSCSNKNRTSHMYLKSAKGLLCRTKTKFCTNYFILIKQMYMTGNYQGTIDMIHYINHRIHSQLFTYTWSLDYFFMIVVDKSCETLIKSYILSSFDMYGDTSIDELDIECSAAIETQGILFIPPLVYLNLLLLLSYTRLCEYWRCCEVLDELHTIIHHDNGYHIPNFYKGISWEILGICQQICGDRLGAFQSYTYALDHKSNYFKEATISRMNTLSY